MPRGDEEAGAGGACILLSVDAFLEQVTQAGLGLGVDGEHQTRLPLAKKGMLPPWGGVRAAQALREPEGLLRWAGWLPGGRTA